MENRRPARRHWTRGGYAATAVIALALFVSACAGGGVSEPPAETEAEAPVEVVVEQETTDAAPTEPAEQSARQEVVPPEPVAVDQLRIELTPVAAQFREPLLVTHAGDGSGRIFVVEKAGTIRILQDGQALETPFLDIRDRVESSGSEMGLLGLAFAPDFAESGHFFVNYTGAERSTYVSRFAVDPADGNAADPSSEFNVLKFVQPAGNHNGGMLAFGPDGYLYIGTGDGGAAFDQFGNGQNPATLLGKMLRLDVTTDPSTPYLIPDDNPWVTADWNGADVLDEIWAVGLRNPWRYSFDRETGDLWIADVGQNQFEEINLTPAESPGGLNYGWPIQEATHCLQGGCDDTGLVQPVLEYDHAGGHCSVSGGYVYRGSQYPALNGVYLYGDYCSGAIWAAAPDGSGVWRSALIDRVDARISSFGEDEAGELYMADLSGGTVYQVGLAE